MAWQSEINSHLTSPSSSPSDSLSTLTHRVWCLEHRDGLPLCVLPHPCFVYAVCFTNSAEELFTGAYDGSIRLWQVNSADIHVSMSESL